MCRPHFALIGLLTALPGCITVNSPLFPFAGPTVTAPCGPCGEGGQVGSLPSTPAIDIPRLSPPAPTPFPRPTSGGGRSLPRYYAGR